MAKDRTLRAWDLQGFRKILDRSLDRIARQGTAKPVAGSMSIKHSHIGSNADHRRAAGPTAPRRSPRLKAWIHAVNRQSGPQIHDLPCLSAVDRCVQGIATAAA